MRADWRIIGPRTRRAGFDATTEFLGLAEKPTAAVCWNDLVAIGLMNGLARAGLTPGEEISVTGYDDLAEAEIAMPSLTTVWNGQSVVGERAAKVLVSRIRGTEPVKPFEMIRPILRERDSTGSPK